MSRNDVPLIENNLDFLPFVPDAVILADGEYPVHEYPLRLLRETPYIVCCDGAANTFISHGYIPNMIIGDGDSLSVENRMLYKDRLLYVADQETNDLTKAIRFLLGKNFRNVVILGATGKREDHTLGNISLLMEHFPCFLHLAMVTDYGVFIPVCDSHTFGSRPGQQVSVFNFGACDMRSEGLVYPVRDFSRLWEGTLNETLGSVFSIFCKGNYLVYLAYDVK
ncbi:thiamine diphosphokinase [Coprobacter fastidiosus]|uniref:thiamine diphosphokinase n=1 Tax=Coprobacter fastidiosus TaxID=1099853 RepID=UPI00241E49D1|nr:thiamine diphosphokinase [Coprobacter fastidiosus]